MVNWGKIRRFSAAIYFFVYGLGMVLPRTQQVGGSDFAEVFFIRRIFHMILYYGGPLEPIANFLLLIPAFFLLVAIAPRLRPVFVLWFCFFLSAAAEWLQSFIPGRVSSLRDFALNSAGSATAFYIFKFSHRSIKAE